MPLPEEELQRQIEQAAASGLLCSQIVMEVGLRHLGLRRPEVVKAMAGLVGAMGFKGVTCGTLTAAGCLIALAGQERLGRRVYLLIEELEERFNALSATYPGNRCSDFLDHEPGRLPSEVCVPLIKAAIMLALELLAEAGVGAASGSGLPAQSPS